MPSEDLPTAENLSILLESRDIYRNASTPLALVSAFIHIAVSELDLLDATTTDVTDTGRETGLNTLITLAYRHACSSYLNEGSTIVKATKAISSDRIDIIAALNRARTIASQNDAEFKGTAQKNEKRLGISIRAFSRCTLHFQSFLISFAVFSIREF